VLVEKRLQEAGHRLAEKSIVPDDIYSTPRRGVPLDCGRWRSTSSVISTGCGNRPDRGGISTPEAIRVLLDKEIEGFGEIFRWLSWEEIGASTLQSRCLAEWPIRSPI